MSDDTVGKFWDLSLHDDESDICKPYDLSSKPTGYCYVYNNIKFNSCYPRTGCDKDFSRIETTFRRFGLEVVEKRDKTVEEMERELREIATSYDEKHSCIVVFFNSHGLSGDRLFDVEGNCVKIHKLVRLFNGANCPQLVGKPKLFFVEMCRGGRVVINQNSASSRAPVVGGQAEKEVLPVDQDILMVFSTGYGFESMYDFDNGTWFIQALTEVLQKWGHSVDIFTILQRTTALIGKRAGKEGNDMCPTCESSLSRPLRFNLVQE